MTIMQLSPESQGVRTKSRLYEFLWMLAESVFVNNSLQISSYLRVMVLRMFGAKIGRDVIIRNCKVKWPWNLQIGDRCWIGEKVWFHNQDVTTIGNDTVISQDTFITTGSHELTTMELTTSPVIIGSNVWITSRCVVTKGVIVGDGVVVTPNSVVYKSISDGIYGGNPITFLRKRYVE